MSIDPLYAVDHLYSFCEECEVLYHRVEHDLFRDFCQCYRALQHQLGEEANDPGCPDLIRHLRRYRFALSAAPLPFNHPGLEPLVGGMMIRSLAAGLALAYPHAGSLAREAAEIFLRLRECPDNPVLDCIEGIFGQEDGSVAILVRDSRLAGLTKSVLRARSGLGHFETVGLDAVRGRTTYARLIVIGPARWFPDHVFRAPRSRLIDVVAYRWSAIRWHPAPTFVGSDGGFAGMDKPILEPEDEAETDEPLPEIDWSQIARHGVEATNDPQDERDHELIAAHLFVLDGGNAVFLEATDGARCLAIDPRDCAEARVKRIENCNLEPGMFVLLRTEGGGDFIVPVADKILGASAGEYRAVQRHWKLLLRNHVLRTGLLETCIQLLNLGSTRANEGNARNWMSERTIGTERDNDFIAIMRLVGLEREAERYRKITRLIKAAHLRAGKVIRRRLLEQVMAADVGDLEKKGMLVFELPDAEGGQLSAFRVEGRAPATVTVPASRLDRVFARED